VGLFVYFIIYTILLFGEEEGMQVITMALISIFTAVFTLVIYQFSTIVFRFFIIVSVIVFVPFYIANEFVGGLSNAHFMAMFLTDVNESSSYIKVIPPILIIKSLLIAMIGLYFVKSKLIEFNKKIAFALFTFIIAYSGFKYYRSLQFLKDSSIYTFKTIYIAPLRNITRSISMYQEVKKELVLQRDMQKLNDSWEVVESENPSDITVVVIGESVRKDFLGNYNPKFKKFTPFINNIPKIQFNNAISYGFQTAESLASCFMQQDNKGKPYFPNNIITLTKKANNYVTWISNQGAIGVEDNFIAAMGKQADYYNFVSKGRWNDHVSDEKMLDVLQKRIKIPQKKNQVFFMHMIGSHPDPCDITNNEYVDFVNSKNISCYVESIRRTDLFLENIYNELKATNKTFSIVYFSDHGLYLNNNERVYHRNGYKESYDVPFFVINSSLDKNEFYNQPRNTKDFILFYQELLNIKTKNINKSYRFISDDQDKNYNILYEGFDYEQLESNKNN